MTAVGVLEVKLAGIRHVRDAAYWKLPVGSPIISHPKLSDLQDAPVGSKIAFGESYEVGRPPQLAYTKIGPNRWQNESGPKSTRQWFPEDDDKGVAGEFGEKLRRAKLAIPKGTVAKGKFRDLFGTAAADLRLQFQ